MAGPDCGPRGAAGASWQALGTTVVLRVCDARALPAARAAAELELAAIDEACSRFRADSELSRANARAGRPVAAGPLLLAALEQALRGALLTDGDLDPTLGSALELAGYDRDFSLLAPPADGGPSREPLPPRVRARVLPGWQRVHLDRARGTVTVPPGVKLDLGSSAKALCADRIAGAAARAGSCGALAALGGDVSLAGPAPGQGWEIRVTDDHRADPAAAGETIFITTGGLATSSVASRRWSHGGRTMHHVLDPRSGQPVGGPLRTVSVAAASCVDANIAATAALVRGAAAPAWLAELGLPARLAWHEGEASYVAGWPRPPRATRGEALTAGRALAA